MRHGRTFRTLRATLERFNDAAPVATRLGHLLALFGDPTGGAGGAGGAGGDDDDAPSGKGRLDAAKLIRRFRGRAEEALAHVVDENADYREERRALRAKLPKDGERVISAADAALLDRYKTLGTPEVLTKAVTDAGELATKLAGIETTQAVNAAADEAAKLTGYNAAILRDLVTDKKLALSFRDETVDGKPVRIPLVKSASDANAQPTKLVDFAAASLAAYLPALTAKPAATSGGQPATQGTPYPAQSSASDTGRGANQSSTGPKPIPGVKDYIRPSQQRAAAASGQTAAK